MLESAFCKRMQRYKHTITTNQHRCNERQRQTWQIVKKEARIEYKIDNGRSKYRMTTKEKKEHEYKLKLQLKEKDKEKVIKGVEKKKQKILS